MKKQKTENQEKKPRRLRLSRETIRFLNDAALLALARGGDASQPCSGTTSQLSWVANDCDSDPIIWGGD